MKKFFLYLVRWQLSSPILAVCLMWMGGWNVAIATIVANLIGGCIFFWVDKWIFGDKKERPQKLEEDISIVLPTVTSEDILD